MSRGKYSPNLPNAHQDFSFFVYNCLGQMPEEWSSIDAQNFRNHVPGAKEYNPMTMNGGYDKDGYDRYGYSDFIDGKWVGTGCGQDRDGKTETDYLLEHLDDEYYR